MLTDRGVKKNRPTEKTEKKLTDRQNLIHRLKKQKKTTWSGLVSKSLSRLNQTDLIESK